MKPSPRKRILFCAEVVTLAHLARPLALAQSLDRNSYEVYFACANRYERFLTDSRLKHETIQSISIEDFLSALTRGAPPYDYTTLESYVAEDKRLLEEINPDVVIGDFRLSLSVSATEMSTPYIAIANAYWSPYAEHRAPLPELPLTRFVGVKTASMLFRLVQPLAFAVHALPFNRLRRKHGLPRFSSLRDLYTKADLTVYADVPSLVPTRNCPTSHKYIGPILWSPDAPLPPWWSSLPEDGRFAYVTLGSSGQEAVLPAVLEALEHLDLTPLVATAGTQLPSSVKNPPRSSAYLPGDIATRHSSLVICNGGSPTVMQALSQGVPVVGIASNMDQYLNMSYVEDAGAGRLVRSGLAKPETVLKAVREVVENASFTAAARRISCECAHFQAPVRFKEALDAVVR